MDINKVNFIKKSFIDYEGKLEKVIIYREQGEEEFHFMFDCPKCGKHNEFSSKLTTEKRKLNGKSKEAYVFSCKYCNQEYYIERLKPPRGRGK